MWSGHRCSLLPALLLLVLPAVWGDCGPLPNINHAEPPEDAKHQGSFSVGSAVRYSCLPGYVKRPLLSDTIQCLTNSQWSNLQEFCGRSCSSPPQVHFARISQEDETQSFYPVGVTVKYNCRPGYENNTEQLPTSTCLDNLTWSEVPELCQRKSCGIPANPEHGKVIANDHLFGVVANVVCDRGYTLKGASPLIVCSIMGGGVAWTKPPLCQPLSCPQPPSIPDGKHDGNGTGEFVYDSVVMYTCDPGLQLVGNETLRCTTENSIDGVWSGSPPECRVLTSTAAVTNHTEPSQEWMAENPYWLAGILIPCCIVPPVALGILAGIIMRWKDNKKHSYNMHVEKHKRKGRDPPMHPKRTDDTMQPVPWNSYFCHTTSCHVCPTCEERLHAAVAPRAEPMLRGCATCEDWIRTQPGTPRTFSVPSISSGESWSPAGTSSSAKAADEWRDEGPGEADPEWSKAEQPMDHKSNHHVCPVCENWLRAHLGQREHHPAASTERLCQQDEGPQGPVCPLCADRLHLSLAHSDRGDCPVCPLAGEGALAHLVTPHNPGCHICPLCSSPTHMHLCQPWDHPLGAANQRLQRSLPQSISP
ncbi:uncharacterized protein [Phaenicophaeus curvirostris]|uniref:uncharacterized protein n=1 Tax=Phaenicophaeus curvirostris TaxID=33595 RepID=UPI0037F0E22D